MNLELKNSGRDGTFSFGISKEENFLGRFQDEPLLQAGLRVQAILSTQDPVSSA
jgi:hypothetical protein